MGSFSSWFLLVALVPLFYVVPVCCQQAAIVKEDCRMTVLLAIKNNESGLLLEIYQTVLPVPENGGSVDDSGEHQWRDLAELEPQITHFIPGRSLFSGCGDQYFRCQELLVINESLFVQNDSREFITIVFVPLENGVLLLSYWYDSNNMKMERSIFTVNSSDCSPMVFYNINNIIYTVCINTEYEYVAVYELQLNLTGSVMEFEGASLIEPWVTSINVTFSTLSNFIIVDHMIFFAIGNTIIVMDIFDTKLTQQYPELPHCTQIHKLVLTVSAGNQQVLVAYCTDRYAYFDPVYGDWTNTQFSSSSGLPYLCPDNNYRATFFINGTLQFSLSDSLLNTINNVNISSGICFESQNRTYFAYSDQQHNRVYVYDFFTQNYYPVSRYDCIYHNCPQLLLLKNQYLLIRDADYDLVLDAKTDFSLIVNISSGIADILVVLYSNVYSVITPSPPIVIHSTVSTQVSSSINCGTVITPLPLISLNSTIMATISPDTNVTKSSTYSTTMSFKFTVTTTAADNPTKPVVVHSNSVALVITLTIVGLFAFIIILAMIVVGFSVRYLRRKW